MERWDYGIWKVWIMDGYMGLWEYENMENMEILGTKLNNYVVIRIIIFLIVVICSSDIKRI